MVVNPKALKLAKMLIRALAAPFDASKLKGSFEERLQSLIQSRADTALAAQTQGSARQRAPVVDIPEALRKSLEKARKPPKSEKTVPSVAKALKRRARSRS